MNDNGDTYSIPLATSTEDERQALPGLLVAFVPDLNTVASDRFSIDSARYSLGRSSRSDLAISDSTVSSEHCLITTEKDGCYIEDLGSYNGTHVDNHRMAEKAKLENSAVIRIGQSVFVFHDDVRPFLSPAQERYGFVGKFHVHQLTKQIERASLSGDHLLLAGPSGAGKELAARAVRSIVGAEVFISHNAADYGTEDESITTLFGVAKGAYTGVSGRQGLIQKANNGVLFLDEFHRYPARAQTSLLRGIETGEFRRPGDTRAYQSNVRFVLASNAPPPSFNIVHDLLGRLQVVRIPPLSERRADIPGIFNFVLKRALDAAHLSFEPLFASLDANHYETLCLSDFNRDNVRGLIRLAHLIVGDLRRGTRPEDAIFDAFHERFGDQFVSFSRMAKIKIRPVRQNNPDDSGLTRSAPHSRSVYEKNRTLIERIYMANRGNVAATVRVLKDEGVTVNHRWLTHFIRHWNLPAKQDLKN